MRTTSRRRHGGQGTAILLLVVLVAAGCGSTVSATGANSGEADGSTLDAGMAPTVPSGARPSDGGERTQEPAPSSGALTATPGQVDDSLGPVAGPSGSPTPTGSRPTTSPDTTAPSESSGPTPNAIPLGHGVTEDAVYIGYSSARDLSTVAGTLGIEGTNTGDIDGQVRAVVNDINGRGGLLGREIKLVNHDYKAAQSNREAQSQAACATWTQDHQVFAVMDTAGASDPVLEACLTERGVPLLSNWLTRSANAFARNPLVVGVSEMPMDDYVPAVVDRLAAQDFFTSWDTVRGREGTIQPIKIGLTHFDNEVGNTYAELLRGRLAEHGYEVAAEESHSEDLSDNAASTSSAVLRFKAEGVTHVFNANLFFYQQAENQDYHPRYAIDDYISTPQLLAENVGPSQLHGALGAGYQPLAEVADPADPTLATARCRELMNKAGHDTSSQFTFTVMLGVCDPFGLLEAGLDASRDLTATGLVRGIESLGSGFVPGATYNTFFSPTRHAGANGVRDFVYDDTCRCFTFPDSTIHPVE